MRKKIGAWAIFLGCLFLLGLASSRYVQNAERVLLPLRLLLLVGISALAARKWWRDQREARTGWQNLRNDAGSRFLERIRQWYYGESKPH